MPNIVNLITVSYKHTDAMNEISVEEMPDPLISTPDINLAINNESVGDLDLVAEEYKNEMNNSGLLPSDVQSFMNEFKFLEDIKKKRIHCTSCNKHIGCAPNDLQNRYEHPLLKVLICGECFQFYSSGDFEKDEDGSELYCRWCGEGGQVFCCTKCPYVFCKKCIIRNLGKATAKIIEESDNWYCFSCDVTQISHLRAIYWAVQKYSEEIIKQSKIIDDINLLSIDDSTCCIALKRKSIHGSKSGQPPNKRQKIAPTSPSKQKDTNIDEDWKPHYISEEPEDVVICTPDIMPLVNSPSLSPLRPDSPTSSHLLPPPPLIPLIQQTIPHPILPKVPSLRLQTPVSRPLNVPSKKKQLTDNISRIILTPNQIKPGSTVVLRKSLSNQKNTNYRNQSIMPKVLLPRKHNVYRVSNNSNSNVQIPTTSKEGKQEWFTKAVNDCTAVAEYITKNLENLSDVHSQAHGSEKIMRELHNAIQTCMHVAIEKIKRTKNVIRNNFEKDFAGHFTKKKVENINEDNSSSEENNSRDSHSFRNKTTGYVLTKNVKPDEMLFDMDVTNASDEENQSGRNSAIATPTNLDSKTDNEWDDDIEVLNDGKNNEVIQIMDSDDEKENEQIISGELLQKIQAKYNINFMSCEELTKYLSAVVVVAQKRELSNKVLGKHTKTIINNIVNTLLKDSVFTDSNKDNNEEPTLKDEEETSLITDEVTNTSTEAKQDEVNVENRTVDSEINNENSVSSSNQCDIDEDKEVCDIEDILGSNIVLRNNKSVYNNSNDNDSKEMCDIEDILSSNVVLRKNTFTSKFDDAFSKFVSQKSDEESRDVPDNLSDSLKETINIVQELDIPEYVNDICTNRDNGSLSIPPETGITANDMDLLMSKEIVEESKGINDTAVNNEILTLQQMAENCVTSVDIHQNSAKCKG